MALHIYFFLISVQHPAFDIWMAGFVIANGISPNLYIEIMADQELPLQDSVNYPIFFHCMARLYLLVQSMKNLRNESSVK